MLPPRPVQFTIEAKLKPTRRFSIDILLKRKKPLFSRRTVNVFAFRVLITGVFRQDLEGMSSKVVSLSLEQAGRKRFRPVSIKERQCRRKGWSRNTPERSLGNDTTPSRLCLVDGLVEKVIEEQVLKIRLSLEGFCDLGVWDRKNQF